MATDLKIGKHWCAACDGDTRYPHGVPNNRWQEDGPLIETSHTHQYTIPVEWAYQTKGFNLIDGRQKEYTVITTARNAQFRIVTKLMCQCGAEVERNA